MELSLHDLLSYVEISSYRLSRQHCDLLIDRISYCSFQITQQQCFSVLRGDLTYHRHMFVCMGVVIERAQKTLTIKRTLSNKRILPYHRE